MEEVNILLNMDISAYTVENFLFLTGIEKVIVYLNMFW